jgi:hypothetical protein
MLINLNYEYVRQHLGVEADDPILVILTKKVFHGVFIKQLQFVFIQDLIRVPVFGNSQQISLFGHCNMGLCL